MPSGFASVVSSCSAASTIISVNTVQITASAAGASGTNATFQVSKNPNTSNFFGDMFFTALYPAADAAGTITARETAFRNAFVPPIVPTKMLVFGVNSHDYGLHSTLGDNIPWQAGLGRASADDGFFTPAGANYLPALPGWTVFNYGVSGQTLAADFIARTNWHLWSGSTAGLAKYTFKIGSPTNDIAGHASYTSTAAAQTDMNTLYTNTTVAYVTYLKTQGFTDIVVDTVVPRTGFSLGAGNFFEDARIQYNSNVTGGAVANGYTANDRCVNPHFNAQNSFSNTAFYFSDGIHPNNHGYAELSVTERANILSA